jgi:hypothetical protein
MTGNIEATKEAVNIKTRTPRNYESILNGALALPLKERADLRNALNESIDKEKADLKAAADEAAKL